MWRRGFAWLKDQLEKHKEKTEGILIIRASWLHRLVYFSPLIGFILAYSGMRVTATSVDWQIYLLSLIVVTIFAFNAGTKPIVRIEKLHLSFYHAVSGRLNLCYIDEIRYVEVRSVYLAIHLRDGEAIASPYLRRSDIKKTLQELERRHIFISYTPKKRKARSSR